MSTVEIMVTVRSATNILTRTLSSEDRGGGIYSTW